MGKKEHHLGKVASDRLRGSKWKIGNGRSFSVFRYQWIPKVINRYGSHSIGGYFSDFKVADLYDPQSHRSRAQLISVVFWDDVEEPREGVPDELFCEAAKDGVFAVKSAYFLQFNDKYSAALDNERVIFNLWGKLWVWVSLLNFSHLFGRWFIISWLSLFGEIWLWILGVL